MKTVALKPDVNLSDVMRRFHTGNTNVQIIKQFYTQGERKPSKKELLESLLENIPLRKLKPAHWNITYIGDLPNMSGLV